MSGLPRLALPATRLLMCCDCRDHRDEIIENAKAASEAALGADEATQAAAIKTMQEAINASELSLQLTQKIQSTRIHTRPW